MPTGTVKWFNATKGYGFIGPEAGGKDIFVHISAVQKAGLRTLNEGQKLAFEIEQQANGRAAAVNLAEHSPGPRRSRRPDREGWGAASRKGTGSGWIVGPEDHTRRNGATQASGPLGIMPTAAREDEGACEPGGGQRVTEPMNAKRRHARGLHDRA